MAYYFFIVQEKENALESVQKTIDIPQYLDAVALLGVKDRNLDGGLKLQEFSTQQNHQSAGGIYGNSNCMRNSFYNDCFNRKITL